MDIKKIVDFAIEGLYTDGGHHKQWYLEEIIEMLGGDLEKIKADMIEKYGEWEEGIPD